MSPTLQSIRRYPLKSAAGQELLTAQVQPRGLAGDRRWMVVDGHGKFISGRSHPQLVRVSAELQDDGSLRLGFAGMPPLPVAQPDPHAAVRVAVTVWSSQVQALLADATAAQWLSAVLGTPARLVFMDDAAQRPVDPDHSLPGDEVSFADGFPLLLVSAAALDHLNAKASHAVDMRRFRPNLVVAGTAPHAEDQWRRIRIGAIEFELPKPCVRCVFTTIDADLGVPDAAGEPLATLKSYRRGPKGITFGMNVIARGDGVLRVGDAVQVLQLR